MTAHIVCTFAILKLCKNEAVQTSFLPIKSSLLTFFQVAWRNFKLEIFEKGKFIPLLMYGSAWWDADCECYRFCGDSELSPDMTSELFKDSPHYFIIGVKFE